PAGGCPEPLRVRAPAHRGRGALRGARADQPDVLPYRRDVRTADPAVELGGGGRRVTPNHACASARCTAAQKASMSAGSLTPRELSTPDDTSTPAGRTRRIASPTFSGVSPPARMMGLASL